MARLPDLADPEDVAAWLGVPSTDDRLRAALSAASQQFRVAVRHPVTVVTDETVTLDGNGSNILLLPAAPVTAVAAVQVCGAAVTDFEWSPTGVLRRTCGRWPDRMRAVQVTYSHGYDPVPDEVADVVVELARVLYRTEPGVSGMQVGGESTTLTGGATDAWRAVVAAYGLGDRS